MGEVIDFATAASRLRRRHRAPRTWEDGCRDEILRDFQTWPRAFRARLNVRRALERIDNVIDPDSSTLGRVLSRRQHAGEGWLWFPHALRSNLAAIRGMANDLREARDRPRTARNRARDLRSAKDRLLWFLFEYGFRKVPRGLLVEQAAYDLAREREELARRIADGIRAALEARETLLFGVVKAGPRRGEPFSPRYERLLCARIARAQERVSRDRQRLNYLESDPPPLRAWGFDFERAAL